MNIFVAGHQGMVGSALLRALALDSSKKIITVEREGLDLLNQKSVISFFEQNHIDQVYLAAAKVGGIHANNKYPAQFIYENLMIQTNIIHAAHLSNVEQLLFLGSSCIYPKFAPQPMKENSLLTGTLESTNEPYAIAKIAGIKLCESYNRQYGRNYRSVMPTNLFGPNDNYHPQNSHVIPAMMRRFHEAKKAGAKQVLVWGTGKPRREFLHVDQMASACVHLMNLPQDTFAQATPDNTCSHINVGSGKDCSIRELAEIMANVVGFAGQLTFDTTRPDGAPQKLLSVERLKSLGWESSVSFEEGLTQTYEWFLENYQQLRES